MRYSKSLAPLVPFVVIVLGLEILVRSQWISSYLLPAPSEVWRALWSDESDLFKSLLQTLQASVLALLLSGVGGVILGILLSSTRWMEAAFLPYAIFFQTVPIIAIAPLLVIWIGYGFPTVVASGFIVSIFPMIASTLSGLRSTDPALRDLFRLYGASRSQSLWKLRLPYALPSIFTGLRISSGLAVIGCIVGEFIAGGGLGGSIDVARTRQQVDVIFAAILLASLIGLLMTYIVNRASRLSLRHWHPSESEIA